jgi:hypothetical protein
VYAEARKMKKKSQKVTFGLVQKSKKAPATKTKALGSWGLEVRNFL